MPRPLFTPGKDPVPIVQEAVWSSGSVWTGAENLAVPTELPGPPLLTLQYNILYQNVKRNSV